MKRIAVLTAGGDTPALNATLDGIVARANQRRLDVYGIIKGFSGLLNPTVPHVVLNPLYQTIPELDPTRGGTILGSTRDYLDSGDRETVSQVVGRLSRLGIDGLICVGGDGTLNGMQALSGSLPVVLAPKTIDNDLGLNYLDETSEWEREPAGNSKGYVYRKHRGRRFSLDEMVNYCTPGFATAVYVSASAVQRVRTTAESHRRIAIVEVMGRDCGMLALGASYGQPDAILVPESPVDVDRLVRRIEGLLEKQKHAVIVASEGVVDGDGRPLGALRASTDPARNVVYNGAGETLQALIADRIGDDYFRRTRRHESANAAVFVRKVGHTQRGGRPIRFDRFTASQLGGKAVDLLVEGYTDCVATLSYRGGVFECDSVGGNRLRDRWGTIHARPMSRCFYDEELMQPSAIGVEYLRSIFENALGADDVESTRGLFDGGHLTRPYFSVNVDVHKRIRRLET